MRKLFTIFGLLALIGWSGVLNAQSWAEKKSGVTSELSSVFFVDENVGYVCGTNGTIIKTINGGDTWVSQNSGTTVPLREIHFINRDTGFIVGGIQDGGSSSGKVLSTTDGGATWLIKSLCSNSLMGIHFINNTTGVLIGGYTCGTTIFRTNDMGKTWVSVVNPSGTIWGNDLFFLNETHGYIVGSHNKFLKTTDGGISWTGGHQVSSSNHMGSVCFTSENVGYNTGPSGVSKTTNGGALWNVVSSIAGGNVKFINENIGYFINGKNLYKTDNAGVDWSIAVTTSYNINSYHFINSGYGFLCGQNGLLMKYSISCSNVIVNDTTFNTVSNIEFQSESPKIIIDRVDSLTTKNGGCDSVIHRYSKYVYSTALADQNATLTTQVNGLKTDTALYLKQIRDTVLITNQLRLDKSSLNGQVASLNVQAGGLMIDTAQLKKQIRDTVPVTKQLRLDNKALTEQIAKSNIQAGGLMIDTALFLKQIKDTVLITNQLRLDKSSLNGQVVQLNVQLAECTGDTALYRKQVRDTIPVTRQLRNDKSTLMGQISSLEMDTTTLGQAARSVYNFKWTVDGSVVTKTYSTSTGDLIISLYPNPTPGQVTIECSETITDLVVSNIQGQIIVKLHPNAKETSFILDKAIAPLGEYFVTITTAKGVSSHTMHIEQ